MELLQGETVVWRGHPSWRAHLGYYIVWGGLAFVPVAIAGLLRANDRGTGLEYWQWILISFALAALVVLVDAVRRRAVTYTITSRRLHIRRGILRRADQSTHLDRVQNLNTRQTLLDRLLGVGTVDFDTAGSEAEEASFSFVGVGRPHGLVHTVETVRARDADVTSAGGPGAAGL
ncbi:MAG: PH domain-containing protein [Actinomycetota bacterium]